MARHAIGRQDDVVVEVAAEGDDGARQRHNAVRVAGSLDLQLEPDGRLGHLIENVQLLMEHDARGQSFQSHEGAAQGISHLRPCPEALGGRFGHGPLQQRVDDRWHFGSYRADRRRRQAVVVGGNGFGQGLEGEW